MHTFINSRAMAQMVAFDLIAGGHQPGRRTSRAARAPQVGAARPTAEADVAAPEPRPPAGAWRRALHLLH